MRKQRYRHATSQHLKNENFVYVRRTASDHSKTRHALRTIVILIFDQIVNQQY